MPHPMFLLWMYDSSAVNEALCNRRVIRPIYNDDCVARGYCILDDLMCEDAPRICGLLMVRGHTNGNIHRSPLHVKVRVPENDFYHTILR